MIYRLCKTDNDQYLTELGFTRVINLSYEVSAKSELFILLN